MTPPEGLAMGARRHGQEGELAPFPLEML